MRLRGFAGLLGAGGLLIAGAAWAAPSAPLQADVGPGQEVQVLERIFAPGESSGWHVHHGVEMTHVVKGEMTLNVTGEGVRVLRAGDRFKVARDVAHEATNTGKADAGLIVTYLIDKGGPAKVPVPAPVKP